MLAWQPLEWVPFVLLTPFCLYRLASHSRTPREAFGWGWVTATVLMLLSFYWVIYTLHVFGELPWMVSACIFVLFCGFAALNFPLYLIAVQTLERRFPTAHPGLLGFRFAIVFPALFTILEDFVPKLFPWKVGHCLYQTLWLVQIVDCVGTTFLTFLLFSLGSTLAAVTLGPKRISSSFLAFPISLLLLATMYSYYRLKHLPESSSTLRLAVIQPSIGTQEKAAALRQDTSIDGILKTHFQMTEEALRAEPPPELILWSETAIPTYLHASRPTGELLHKKVQEWKTPLITGGFYSNIENQRLQNFNAAFLFDPGSKTPQVYAKNILLAFGEYLPLGQTFPRLYELFPLVGGLTPETHQTIFSLGEDTRIGCTICYEMILPEYVRKVTGQGIHLLANLTIDTWYGRTVQPREHAALTVFRSIESHVPAVRATNSGLSFTVNSAGQMGQTLGVFEKGILQAEIALPDSPPLTVYVRWGDWILILYLGAIVIDLILQRRYAPLPS